ncbi:hypothetical protein ACH5RR_032981 [Cinchona calisaya]|uniref:RRM domain-containing protein n=1 Tax=Cinchona calisaya TaxID=153742 RepID=A0ABD2YJM7_9GENT
MSRSGCHKEIFRYNSELSLVRCSEGTSARTRPFSFEDIMIRRKNKKLGEIQAASRKHDGGRNSLNSADDLKTAGGREHDSFHGGSRPVSENSVRVRSRRKEDNTCPINDGQLAKDRSGESRDPEAKLKSVITNLGRNDATGGKSDRHAHDSKRSARSSKDSKHESGERHSRDLSRKERSGEKASRISVKEREHKQVIDNDRKQVYSKSRDVDQTRHDYENEPKKRHSRALSGKDNNAEAVREKSEKKSKRKHQDENKERTGDRDSPRKHDKHKSKNLQSLERKEKEPSQVHYEESRAKRKRSPSREHDKDRIRRSPSVSPRAYMRKSLDDHHYSSKDKSQSSHVDTERKRVSSNGSNSNYRQYYESSSGLGGYSPRKRKTEAAAKTPSPLTHSPELRTVTWDHAPAEKECDIISSHVSNAQPSSQIASDDVPKPSSVIPVTSVTVKPVGISHYTSSSQIHDIDSIQLTQATRPMRRLYVENLPSSASEKAVMECINDFLLSSGVNHIKGTFPCISCMIHKEKGQALLEFLTPEDASAALSFDGRSLFGSVLKIRRPKDFVQVTTGVDDKSVDATSWISNDVEDSSHKIFIGGISKVISAQMLMEIAGAFGSLKAFHLGHSVELDAQYGFLEYVDHSVTQKACAGLNGMKLGGQVLTVVQAIPDAPVLGNANQLPLYGIPEHAKPLLKNPTEILKLKNALDPKGLLLLSYAELEEILEDIRLECARFGTVKAVNVVKNDDDLSTGEAFAVVDDRGSAMDYKDNLEEARENTTCKELESNRTLEPPNGSIEAMGVDDETVKCDGISDHKPGISKVPFSCFNEPDDKINVGHPDHKPIDNVPEDDTREPNFDCRDPTAIGAASQEIPNSTSAEPTDDLNTSTGQLVRNNSISDACPVGVYGMGSEVNIVEGSMLEEDIGRSSASKPDSCGKTKLDVLEKDENEEEIPNLCDIFKAGCVIVEFKRAEASCMAAHCLHERLFDDRIVTVEYVDPDLYHKRFPK